MMKDFQLSWILLAIVAVAVAVTALVVHLSVGAR
jgi:hypothetical protein